MGRGEAEPRRGRSRRWDRLKRIGLGGGELRGGQVVEPREIFRLRAGDLVSPLPPYELGSDLFVQNFLNSFVRSFVQILSE